MQCPNCRGYELSVIDSRHTRLGIRRRRHCDECGETFRTYEVTEAEIQAKVIETRIAKTVIRRFRTIVSGLERQFGVSTNS
jgi:transcriptional regulator NrdR family protein